GVYCVSTGYIQSYRIEGGKHSHIWNYGGIVFSVTVTVRRNINDQANMEIRAALDNGFCIFCDFAVQDIIRFIRCRQHGIFWTDTNASAAAYTFVMIDKSLFVFKAGCVMSTYFSAHLASYTQILIYMRFPGRMHF